MSRIGRKITSLEVAEMVGKEHKNVLRDIKLIIEQVGGRLKVAPSYFEESYYVNSQNKQQPMYLLSKEGCDLFGTRMTGEKGTKFALKYVQRFNEMEMELSQKKFGIPTNYKEALLQLVEQIEQKEQLQLALEEQKPKVEFAESLLSSKTNILIRDFCKILHNKGIETGEKRLFNYLRENGYLLKNNTPSQRGIDLKWFSVSATTISNENGTKTRYTTKITPKGQQELLNKFLKDGINE